MAEISTDVYAPLTRRRTDTHRKQQVPGAAS